MNSYCVPMSNVFDVSAANGLDFNPLTAGWGGCLSMISWCRRGEEDDNEKKWKVLRTKQLASCRNSVNISQDVQYTHDESYCVWPQVAGVSHHLTMWNM